MIGNKAGLNDSIEERRMMTPINGAAGFRLILMQRVVGRSVQPCFDGIRLRGCDCSAKSPAASRNAHRARLAGQYDAPG
jgi:hypothetical protein